MGLSKSTTASYIVLPGAQALLKAEPCSQRKRSRAANWLKSLKSKISNRARKHDDQTARVGEEREEVEGLSPPARSGELIWPSFDLFLPQSQFDGLSSFRAPETPRPFPQDWQTSLHPAGSLLRGNTRGQASNEIRGGGESSTQQRLWHSLGSRSKFFRLVVVANPSLQNLAASHR